PSSDLVNPANTLSSTALDVVSVDVPGCKEGGSVFMLTLNSCSSASSSSPSASPESFASPFDSASSPPPHAAKNILMANTIPRSNDHFFQFIMMNTPPFFKFTDNLFKYPQY